MGIARVTCVTLFVIIVCLHLVQGKPQLFRMLYCDMVCEDYDDQNFGPATTTVASDDCAGCPTRRPPRRRPFNFMIPPSNRTQNVAVMRSGNNWFMAVNPSTPPTTTTSTAQPMMTFFMAMPPP